MCIVIVRFVNLSVLFIDTVIDMIKSSLYKLTPDYINKVFLII